MPKVIEVEGYRIFFYADEGNESPHVHVLKQGEEAKFWIRPVQLASNRGMSAKNLNRARKLVETHQKLAQEKWNEFHSKKY
jgi:Domain of unknown function (DUF4160)